MNHASSNHKYGIAQNMLLSASQAKAAMGIMAAGLITGNTLRPSHLASQVVSC